MGGPPCLQLFGPVVVYDRNSFLLNVQKHSYCTQNLTENLFNRKRNMLLLQTEISHLTETNICLFITETKGSIVINRKCSNLVFYGAGPVP